METSLIGFFLDASPAADAIARLRAAGCHARAGDGEQFDSKWQVGRIAVVVTPPASAIDAGHAADLRMLLLNAGALDIQEVARRTGALPGG